jgi:hypothetical protein
MTIQQLSSISIVGSCYWLPRVDREFSKRKQSRKKKVKWNLRFSSGETIKDRYAGRESPYSYKVFDDRA